ncbi:hypothetical protein [Alkalitalea saponilacus]|uniref:EF-hand domain-containing protein n=1 Tax=Alkalitalea saponilacus TaxID=889453 RepID=A0A1T5HUF3_9BACT|nr:hypothetical protein [Alkalitalea saponilacus]ASB50340.1 hypothetical protein CDL62_14910 [Alkalitalea saponilacus]ASB50491.1 hypothetical protein CDL62_15710 [Alkalitalea saponilacus]SKC24326.1 hypothetical protein SAMN03080601_03628 [Alkalitalea saponilacus]
MDIESVKNYNQKMLAIFSTLIVIIVSIGLVVLIWTIVREFNFSEVRKTENVLMSDERAEQLAQENLRQQIISYDFPRLIDTTKLIYLIPVTIRTLDEPEPTDYGVLGLLDTYDSRKSRIPNKYSFYGTFINLILYDNLNNKSYKIANQRMVGNNYDIEYLNDDILIIFKGAERDTDNDGRITMNDLKSLFIYSLKEKELKVVTKENTTVLNYEMIREKNEILVLFGIDRNKDNQFIGYKEPTRVMKYNIKTGDLLDLVEPSLETEIQRIVDRR